MKEYTEDDPSKVTGYDGLSVEGREQLYQAFEEGKIVDPTFKDTRKIKNSNSPYLKYDVFDAEGFSVSVAKRAAMCRDEDCKSKGVKVTKGQLRLGIVIPYDGEANTVHYKHW